MKLERQLQLAGQLIAEAAHPDTIFLHKHKRGWIAYQHSALLLQHYFTPIRLEYAIICGKQTLCAPWQGIISVQNFCGEIQFLRDADKPDQIQIVCPSSSSGVHLPSDIKQLPICQYIYATFSKFIS